VFLICWIVQAYLVVCVVRVAMSWLDLGQGSGILTSIAQVSYLLTEPLFGMVRRSIPRIGDLPIDFSPMVVILVLGLLRAIVCV
jgi:uncharacterized protein YggT (Ycf19 family)